MSKINKIKVGKTTYDIEDTSKQEILISGANIKTVNNQSILGAGNITIEGANQVTEQTISNWGFTKNTGTYSKPSNGIPSSDLDSFVQASLEKADTALQEHQSLASKQDLLVSGTNIKTINNQSILGSGNINIEGGGEASPSVKDKTVTGTEINITDNYNSDIKNIKMYGKTIEHKINLFNINEFDWTGKPGYVNDSGVFKSTVNSSYSTKTYGITQMKIPVIAGHSYTFENLPNLLSPTTMGIYWFNSSYTGIDTNNTSTAQTGWIGRDMEADRTTGTVIAPAGAAYCEFQFPDVTAAAQTPYALSTTEGLLTSLTNAGTALYDDSQTTTTTELGTLYINNTKTTTNAQSVDLSSITMGADTDYIYKNIDTWYANVNGIDTSLSSSLQTALNSLELSTSTDNYIWASNNNNLSITYSANDNKSLKILLLTNSFGQDSFSYVPSIIHRLVGDEVDIKIGILYIGSCTLERHWTEISGETSAYTYYEATNNEAWSTGVSSTALSKLKKENWDLFILNQLSTSTIDETTFSPYLNNIINWVFTNANKPVKLGMFFGGTYEANDLTINAMYEQSILVLQSVLDDYPIEIFFPNGTAIQNARTNATLDALGAAGHLLYNTHAQEGIPCLIEAYTVVLGLLEILGLSYKSIIGDKPTITDSWITSMNIPGKHGSVVGMTDSNILLAQKCAIMAHKKPFEVSTIE